MLVDNAGVQKDSDMIDMSLDEWRAVIQTNLQGQFLYAARRRCTIRTGWAAS